MLHKLECLLFFKMSQTGGELSLISSSKIEDAICLFTGNTRCLLFYCSIIIKPLACQLVVSIFCHVGKCNLHVFCLFSQLTSTICLFIALAQGMLLYVAAILSLWHILFSFAGLASSYVALFSR